MGLLLAVGTAAAASFGRGDRTPCDPGGKLPTFSGTCCAEQIAGVEQCQGFSLCRGPTTSRVGYDANGKLCFGRTDCQGVYSEMEGASMCAPRPGHPYSDHATGRQTATDDPTRQVFSTGTATLDAEPPGAPRLSGRRPPSFVSKSGSGFGVAGTIRGSCADGPAQ
jgi:hypothetical protein